MKVNLRKKKKKIYWPEFRYYSFRYYDFYDTNHNPDGKFRNEIIKLPSGITVSDTTNLAWLKNGTHAEFKQIKKYLKQLNTEKPGNLKGWRLPTLCELYSLGNCREELFNNTKIIQNIWSCDTEILYSDYWKYSGMTVCMSVYPDEFSITSLNTDSIAEVMAVCDAVQ